MPRVVINSIDVGEIMARLSAGDEEGLVSYLLPELEHLACAGAEFALMAANTPHIVFDELALRSSIPLLSIITSACDAAKNHQYRRLSLFGTRFVMESRLYRDALRERSIELVLPTEREQIFTSDKYQNELLNNVFLSSTREGYLDIVERLKRDHDIEGLILGGTELPLLLPDKEHLGVQFLDTSAIHAEAAVTKIMT